MATGLLVVCLGVATRLSEYLTSCQKEYRAVVQLGQSTDTYDAEGTVVTSSISNIPASIPDQILEQYRGPIQQAPPAFSAIKKHGQPAYRSARLGKPIELSPRTVEIAALTVVDYHPPELTIFVRCSAGTYIRSLAHDLGRSLGCGGHLTSLSRTRSGPFTIEQSNSIEILSDAFSRNQGQDYLLPPDAGLLEWPSVHLEQASTTRVIHGQPVPMTQSSIKGLGLAYGPDGNLIAIVEADPVCRLWRPKKVLTS